MQPEHPANYDFIMNPKKPQRSVGSQSMLMRVAIFGGGLVVLLIIFSVIMNLIRGSDATVPSLTNLMREQQLITHITELAPTQPGVSSENASAAATIFLSVGTQHQEMVNYATENHLKIDAKQTVPNTLAVDTALDAATSGGTYNTTLRSTLKTELTTYKAYLQRAYSNVKGPRGKALIKKDFDAVVLLLKQLDSTPS